MNRNHQIDRRLASNHYGLHLRRGFTLLELLVVISIIGALMSLIASAIVSAREQSRRVQCMNRLRQVALALHGFHSAHRKLPEGNLPGRLWTFQSQLLAYVDRVDLADRIDLSFPDYCFFYGQSVPPDQDPRPISLESFACPADPNAGLVCSTYEATHGRHATNSYLGVSGTSPVAHDGLLFSGSRVRLDAVRDGTSNTLMIGERGIPDDLEAGWLLCAGGELPDYSGNRDNLLSTERSLVTTSGPDNGYFWSHHRDVVQFAFADGSVTGLNPSIDHILLQSLSTRSGSELISF
ncbi:MAG: DUF1559 domain-containing protein [Planctomycetaceae bacterium]